MQIVARKQLDLEYELSNQKWTEICRLSERSISDSREIKEKTNYNERRDKDCDSGERRLEGEEGSRKNDNN